MIKNNDASLFYKTCYFDKKIAIRAKLVYIYFF